MKSMYLIEEKWKEEKNKSSIRWGSGNKKGKLLQETKKEQGKGLGMIWWGGGGKE